MATKKESDHKRTNRTRPPHTFKRVKSEVRTLLANVSTNFEDDSPSSTVVRWLVVLLLLHLLILGGVYVRSALSKSSAPGITLPPNMEATTQPALAEVAVPQEAPKPAAPETITQPEQVVSAVSVTEAPTPVEPVEPIADEAPATAPAEPAAVAQAPTGAPVPGKARHSVRTGDTWEKIARDNHVSVADLKAVNPNTKRLVSGNVLVLPARPGEVVAPVQAEESAEEGTVHIVKKGETLSSIAKKYKLTWQKLQKFNNMTDKGVKSLKIGQKIMIPEKK